MIILIFSVGQLQKSCSTAQNQFRLLKYSSDIDQYITAWSGEGMGYNQNRKEGVYFSQLEETFFILSGYARISHNIHIFYIYCYYTSYYL